MTTFRVVKRDRWTAVDRRTLNDERVSWRALGLLVWLLDKPDNWTTSVDRLAALRGDGEHAIRKAVRELEGLGYIVRTRTRSGGRYHYQWDVHERPVPPANIADGGPPDRPRISRTVPPGDSLFPQVEQAANIAALTDTELVQPRTETPAVNGKEVDPAHQLAVARWEQSTAKPVCGFVALRKRIGEALESGYTPDQVGKVLPAMTVFSRNAFDFALGKGTVGRPDRVDPGGGLSDAERRALPGGVLDLSVPSGPTTVEILEL